MNKLRKAQMLSLAKNDEPSAGLMTFAAMRRGTGLDWPVSSDRVALPASIFHNLLRLALDHVCFDERYYLDSNPDVVDALAKGWFADAQHHYVEFGYFENRLPCPVEVDEVFYFKTYPDIQAAVKAGAVPSAQKHFELSGLKEGRLPRQGWSLPTRR